MIKYNKTFIDRLWSKDPSLWTTDSKQRNCIENRLGWLDADVWMKKHVESMIQWRKTMRQLPWMDRIMLLGMGGSSLAPQVFASINFGQRNIPILTVVDTTSPEEIVEADFNLHRTLIIVSSKSGSTIETSVLCDFFYRRMSKEIKNPGEHFIAITDKGSKLEELAAKLNFRQVFINPSNIGGRYSALSYFGLIPAALLGIDLVLLKDRVVNLCNQIKTHGMHHSVFNLGFQMGMGAINGDHQVKIEVSSEMKPLLFWIEQLISESIGKDGKGILPVYSMDDQIDHTGSSKFKATISILREDSNDLNQDSQIAKYNQISWIISDNYELGAEFFRWEFAIAIAATELQINPFDEPDVSETKSTIYNFIKHKQRLKANKIFSGSHYEVFVGSFTEDIKEESIDQIFRRFFNQIRLNNYIGILAYLPEFNAVFQGLLSIQKAVQKKTNVATTLGFGPSYLHSTGQFHKGGPSQCCFIQIVELGSIDLCIPNRSYTFKELHRAQADGDFFVLNEKKKPIMRIFLIGNRQCAIDQLLSDLLKVL